MKKTFGQIIRQARKEQEYSQRELAKIVGVNYTYLSKLENDHAGYPPSEEVIEALGKNLNLDVQELTTLAGRIKPEDEQVFRELVQQYQEMPAFLRRMQSNPQFAKKVLSEAEKIENED
ncbi:helix-turn-helix transcriptional regulator [Crocosphaera sp. UHCC 0190]|uniref:helix-turn-helix domain-containing protein n=1 Tax=Crocosphaera sp. UHCC 0190 TaxID=3110246 RepID=UPI002B219A08|nr:helix-turn-helix transcriptional regulator [Crocosphaera sp. UHCC 0190]MEA5509056.1 helix-turn-helix transcriptional regulator [Crocosphaera sp. UHCC 0190]